MHFTLRPYFPSINHPNLSSLFSYPAIPRSPAVVPAIEEGNAFETMADCKAPSGHIFSFDM